MMNEKLKEYINAIISIIIGTIVGVIVYIFFLYFKIAIFGWNLGLFFAPIAAGYAEVLVANRICENSTGAISAFILFLITVIYGFILQNPTLGFNLITVGSIIVIIQAAIPIAMNYILLIVALSLITYSLDLYGKIKKYIISPLKKRYYKYIKREPMPIKTEDETSIIPKRNINNRDFIFLTVPPNKNIQIENYLGVFEGRVILKREDNFKKTKKNNEKETLNLIEGLKNEALIKLSEKVKKAGGNGVIDTQLEYDLVGLGGSLYQVTAKGTGVKLMKNT